MFRMHDIRWKVLGCIKSWLGDRKIFMLSNENTIRKYTNRQTDTHTHDKHSVLAMDSHKGSKGARRTVMVRAGPPPTTPAVNGC